MRVSALVEAATHFGVPESEASQRARRLLDVDMLPRASGRRIPEATADHVASYLLTLAAEKVVDAVHAAHAYGKLHEFDDPSAVALAPALAAYLSEPEKAETVARVILSRTVPAAEIHLGDGTVRWFGAKAVPASLVRVDVTIPGAFVHQLAIDLADADVPGWTAEKEG